MPHRILRGLGVGAATLALASAGVVVAAGTVGATGATLYVSHAGTAAASDATCSSAAYTSVQAAVDAATTGDTVYLCGTTPYEEQVIVTKSVTLTGDPGATIAAPSTWTPSADPLPPQFAADTLFAPQALLVIWGPGVDATVSGLAVSGPLPGNGGCAENEYGILVIDGASAGIAGDTVSNIADQNTSLYGCQFGVGIQVGRDYWPTSTFNFVQVGFVGTATVTGTTVTGYQKGGIVADGSGSSLTARNDAVTGFGPTPAIAQNGIQISRGATGSVAHSAVSDNQYTGPGEASSTGVLVYGGCTGPPSTNVSVANNRLATNDVGAALDNFSPTCSGPSPTKTQDSAVNNVITDTAVTNTSGGDYLATPPSTPATCGFQAGVTDFGNHDAIKNNAISGAGYGPATCTSSQATPAFLFTIDTTGSTAPRVKTRSSK